MFVGFQTVFHGTPRYSQTPHFQLEFLSFHRFSILGLHWSLCSYLDPCQLVSGHIPLLLKTLQELIMAIRCSLLLLCLSSPPFSPPSLSSGHTAVPGTFQACFYFRIFALIASSACSSSPRCLMASSGTSFSASADTAFSVRSVWTTPFKCTPLPSSNCWIFFNSP